MWWSGGTERVGTRIVHKRRPVHIWQALPMVSVVGQNHRRTWHTVLGQKVVCPADDEFCDTFVQFLQFLFGLRLDFIAGKGIPSSYDSVLEVFTEIVLTSQIIWICEVQERKIFRKVVLEHWRKSRSGLDALTNLYGRSSQDDASWDLQAMEGLER